MATPNIGPDGHVIPEQQGLVTAVIQPILAKDLHPLGKATTVARGAALYLPQWVRPPVIVPGTERVRDDGVTICAGTPELSSIEVTEGTLEQATLAAARVINMLDKLPLTESAVDLMNMAFALIHHANKGNK